MGNVWVRRKLSKEGQLQHSLFSLPLAADSHYSTRSKAYMHEKAKDLYAVIGVSPHATQKQIKDAYYKLSMKYHPDQNKGSPEAHQKFTELTAAYSVLGQHSLRRKYDKGMLHQYPHRPHHTSRHDRPTSANVHGASKVKFNFDEFYQAHYGEALRREQEQRKERAAARERAKFNSISENSQRLMIVGVTLLVFLAAWYGYHRKAGKKRPLNIE